VPPAAAFDAPTIARHAEMLANRARKTHVRLAPRMAREGIGAWRLYDRDIPEVRAIVDVYVGPPAERPNDDAQVHVVLSEHARQQTEGTPYLDVLADALAGALALPRAHVHTRARRTRPREGERYTQLGARSVRLHVPEDGARYVVNLTDYVDTGLFADMRPLRARVRAEAQGQTVLNLFGYTGSFTVAAARGGAKRTLTVDASGTWLRVAAENLALNGIPEVGERPGTTHRLWRVDAREALTELTRMGAAFDTVVLDPPSFSDHGGQGLEVQRDHRYLVRASLGLLRPGGTLWFCTNHQRFEPDLLRIPEAASVEDATEATVPDDYRNRQVHRCWRIVRA
jgi:23S rRNA G2069 N7-methylase RlmK/C1962 C5-methylase RlmI